MKVSIIYECETTPLPELDCESLAAQVAGEVLRQEGCPEPVQISLVVTDEAGIQEENRQFRGIDSPTDVLSFPMVDFPEPSDYSVLEDESLYDPDTGELMLGDIMICAGRVLSQAREYGHSIRREFAFLVAHSVLHLLGYDHMEPEEAAVMEEKQEAALAALGIVRDGESRGA